MRRTGTIRRVGAVAALAVAVLAAGCADRGGGILDPAIEDVAQAERLLAQVATTYDRLDELGVIDASWYPVLDPLMRAADEAIAAASAAAVLDEDPAPMLAVAGDALRRVQTLLIQFGGTET